MRAFLCAFAVLLGAGCGPGKLGPDLTIRVAPKASNRICSGTMEKTYDSIGAAALRITVRTRSAGMTTGLCDRIIRDVNKEPPLEFKVPPGDTIDVFAEAFTATDERIATGALLRQSVMIMPPRDIGALPILRLSPAEEFSCQPPTGLAAPPEARPRLTQSRAFHTATTLPNGEILIVGGVIPALDGSEGPTATGTNTTFLTGSAELYDPVLGVFIPLKEATPPRVRAFHHAGFVSAEPDGTFKVLVVGGITLPVNMPMAAALTDYGGQMTPNFRMIHQAMVTAAPAEMLTYDPAMRTLRRDPFVKIQPMAQAAYQAAAPLRDPADPKRLRGLVVAGGAAFGGMARGELYANADATDDGVALRTGSLLPADPRVGAGMVTTSSSLALLVGGEIPSANACAMDADCAKLGTNFACDMNAVPAVCAPKMPSAPFARISLAGPVVTPAGANLPMGVTFPQLMFPTLTLLDDPGAATPRVLVSGGLELAGKTSVHPPSSNGGLFVIRVSGNPSLDVTPVKAGTGLSLTQACGPGNHYRSAAWNAATLLPSGDRVLITGGTARNNFVNACLDCEQLDGMADDVLSCTMSQSVIYDIATNAVERVSPGLQIPRFGHTQSLLPDGRVLIVGGLTRRRDGMPRTYGVSEAEVWNPVRKKPPMPVEELGSKTERDDPVRQDLIDKGLSRRPGKQAFLNNDPNEAPATNCRKPGDPP